MARRPIMLMRKKNLLGTVFGRYANLNAPMLAKSAGHFYDVSGAGATFCVKDLSFSSGHYAYIEFTAPPTLGPVGTNGTLYVNGSPLTGWTVDRIEGNRVYISGTPSLEAGDVVTYSYYPDTDGGITNAKGDQLCEQIDAPFREVSGLFRAAINEGSGKNWLLLVGEPASTSTHPADILSLDFEGIYRTWWIDLPVWLNGRQIINLAVNSEVPATQTFNVLNGEEYVFSSYDIFNYSFSGAGVTETLIGTLVGERKAVTLNPTADGILTLTVNSEG